MSILNLRARSLTATSVFASSLSESMSSSRSESDSREAMPATDDLPPVCADLMLTVLPELRLRCFEERREGRQGSRPDVTLFSRDDRLMAPGSDGVLSQRLLDLTPPPEAVVEAGRVEDPAPGTPLTSLFR